MLIPKFMVFFLSITFTCTACHKPKHGDRSDDNNHADKPEAPEVLVTTIAGKVGDKGHAEDGNGSIARFFNPGKMVYDARNNMLYVADGTVIRSVDQQNNVRTYVPLKAIGSTYNDILDMDIAPGVQGGALYIVTKENDLWKIEPGPDGGIATNLVNRIYGGNDVGPLNSGDHFDLAKGLATGVNGTIYFFNQSWNTMHRIVFSSSNSGTVTPFVGKPLLERGGNGTPYPFSDGKGEEATFGGRVSDIAADGNGNIYVADLDNELVRKISPDGTVSSLFAFGNRISSDIDGPVNTAKSNNVIQVAASKDGNYIFFTTYGNADNLSALRMVRPGKDVRTLVGYENGGQYGDGNGKTAGLAEIGGIASTPDGKTVYVSEPGKKVIRKVVIEE